MKKYQFWLLYSVILGAPHLPLGFSVGAAAVGLIFFLYYACTEI